MLCRVIRIKDRGQDVRAGVLAWASGCQMSDLTKVESPYRIVHIVPFRILVLGGVQFVSATRATRELAKKYKSVAKAGIFCTFGGRSVEIRWRFGGDL